MQFMTIGMIVAGLSLLNPNNGMLISFHNRKTRIFNHCIVPDITLNIAE